MNPTYADLLRENASLKANGVRREAEIARLCVIVEDLHRGQKRPIAPFSKGPPKPNPKRPAASPATIISFQPPSNCIFDGLYSVQGARFLGTRGSINEADVQAPGIAWTGE